MILNFDVMAVVENGYAKVLVDCGDRGMLKMKGSDSWGVRVC